MRLIEQLISELKHARDDKLRNFKRVLSVGEYFSDRNEKATYLGFGEGSTVYDSALIYGDVRVGKNVWIGPNTILDGSGAPLIIGDGCNISAGVQIYTHDTVQRVLDDLPNEVAPVTIGSRVYIGPQTVIAKGVSIGDRVVIGAHSLVLSSIPSGKKAWGVPARVQGDV